MSKREDYSTWEQYFMELALLSSERSKDPSTRVGACIVDENNRIISVGYNGLTKGMDDDTFCWDSKGEETGDLYTTKNPWIVHAELNAILNSHSINLTGSTIYVTLFPCNECAKAIIQSGIKKVVYLRMYRHKELVKITNKMFECANVECVPYNEQDLTKEEVQDVSEKVHKLFKKITN